MIAPTDPRHGTYAGAQAHIRARSPLCEPCRLSYRRYQRRQRIDANRGEVRLVPATSARAHLLRLIKGGMTFGDIARASGLGETTVQDIRVNDTILRVTADAMLGVNLAPSPSGLVPAVGSLRRLQALARLGWGQPAILRAARDAGFDLGTGTIGYVLRQLDDTVRVRTHLAIAAAYDALSMTLPPPGRATTSVRNRAAARGYAPPLAWDDIDNPAEKPAGTYQAERRRDEIDEAVVARVLNGDNLPTTVAEKREIVRRWRAAGHPLNELERRTGWQVSRYGKGEAA